MSNENTPSMKKLYDTLFDTLEKVKNGDMDPERAKSVVGVANSITGAAKVELQAMKEMQYSSPILKKKEVNGYMELQNGREK